MFKKLFEDYIVPCACCKKIGQGPLCNQCKISFKFYFSRTYLNHTFKHTDLYLYQYNKFAKTLMLAYKKAGFSYYSKAIKQLINTYFTIDPFLQCNKFINLSKTKSSNLHIFEIFLIPVPVSQSSKRRRGFNHIMPIAKTIEQHLLNLLVQKNINIYKQNHKALKLKIRQNLSNTRWSRVVIMPILGIKPSAAQKQLSQIQRLINLQHKFFITQKGRVVLKKEQGRVVKKILKTITKSKISLSTTIVIHKRIFIIIDDVSTTGATLYYAKKTLEKYINTQKNTYKLIITKKQKSTVYNIISKQHIIGCSIFKVKKYI